MIPSKKSSSASSKKSSVSVSEAKTSSSTDNTTASSSAAVITTKPWAFQTLPMELQVRILSHLRAVDLSAVHQVNRYFGSNKALHHAIVIYCAEQVYPKHLTVGFEDQPTTTSRGVLLLKQGKAKGRTTKNRSSSVGSESDETEPAITLPPSPQLYTFEHLRNMELLAVARVLNSPEPTTGFVVSKSWCKNALRWLEDQQERQLSQHHHEIGNNNKKKSKKTKKKQRKKASSSSSIPPPPANVNSDITCEHDQLQHSKSSRSARARRRLLDKQAWKILKALYPESTPLPAVHGECVQCRAEELQLQKAAADQAEAAKQKRRLPLTDCNIRRFYTRTRGVPEHCLRERQQAQVGCSDPDDVEDRKMPAFKTLAPPTTPIDVKKSDPFQDDDDDDLFLAYCDECPLIDGTYFVLPRSWCHGWRRFMKTGEGGGPLHYAPPDAASLLCDAHRMALLPPHLESFLYGETTLLLGGASQSSRQQAFLDDNSSLTAAVASASLSLPVGQGPTRESILAMRSLGLNEQEVALQLSAMRTIEARQRRQAFMNQVNEPESAAASVSRNELLDRENHSVVEILTKAEFNALETCWPGTTVFGLRFTVESGKVAAAGGDICSEINFCTPICRSCDATGRQLHMSIKNRARGWVRKSAEKSRAPASLAEY